jgi:L-asparaginase
MDPNYLEGNNVHILSTGGTIDKDYPKLTSGYAFEFGDQSAAERILKNHPNLGIAYIIRSICKKDSLEITQQDRSELGSAIAFIIEERKYHPELVRVVVTHGTDTMIDTAMFIKNRLSDEDRARFVIAFTGATKPERFVDSDASFNVGCAVAATSSCKPGSVVICMNGNVIPVEECVRDEASGLFRRKNTQSH